jgi:hypothetical protein
VPGIPGRGGQGLELPEIGAGAGEEEEVSGHSGIEHLVATPDMQSAGPIVQPLGPTPPA